MNLHFSGLSVENKEKTPLTILSRSISYHEDAELDHCLDFVRWTGLLQEGSGGCQRVGHAFGNPCAV